MKTLPTMLYVLAMIVMSSTTVVANGACTGNTEVTTEYFFFEGSGTAVINTGADEDDGNAEMVYGAIFSTDVPTSNADCGWSMQIPNAGSGSTTPALETLNTYDALSGASNFTIMAWVKRESASSAANTSARIVSDTSALSLSETTAGVEFRFSGSSGTLAVRVNGNESSTTVGGMAPNSAAWHHVAVVYDGTRPATNTITRNVHFYENGIQRGNGNTLTGEVVSANSNCLSVGNSSVSRGVANTMVGKIDDVLIIPGYAPQAVGSGKTNDEILCFMAVNDDIERPTITAPNDVSVNTDTGVCTASNVELGQPVSDDNCRVANVENDAPSEFSAGVTPVIWTVTDIAGNSSTCTQFVTVVDAEYPVLVCPDDLVVDAAVCLGAITNIDYGQPAVSDNCSIASVISIAPAEFNIGTTSVTWRAGDAAGNVVECYQQITVVPSRTADCDGDGLTDWEEEQVYMTDYTDPSTADDGFSDGWKVQNGFDPVNPVPEGCRPIYW